MTKEIKKDIIDNLVAIAYYWQGDENANCSLNLAKMLKSLKDITKGQSKKIQDLNDDWVAFFSSRVKQSDIVLNPIPEKYNANDDLKLLYMSTQAIMNLISSTDYEMGYMFLTEMSSEWPELYINVINIIKNNEMKIPFSEWLITHTLVAFDILGKTEIEYAGYRITKLEEGDNIE